MIENMNEAFDAMREQFEDTVTIENVYNRFVLFNGKTHHGVKTFGTKPRLTLNFFGMAMTGHLPPLLRYKMKIAIITDQHFGARKSSRVFHDFFNKFYRNVFFPTLKKRGIDTVLDLGDTYDNRRNLDLWAANWSKT